MRLLPALALLPCLAVAAPSQPVPLVVSHHGRVFDALDQPLDATVRMRFDLFAAADESDTTALWTDEREVKVQQGEYAILFGDTGTTPVTEELFERGAVYLQVSLDGERMLPRVRLVSVPWALRAGTAVAATRVLDGGVGTAALQDSAVSTVKIAKGAVTLDRLAVNASGKLVGLDTDTLDGFDSSAFAPAAITGILGTPPTNSSISQEIASIRTTAETLSTRVGTPSSGTIASGLAGVQTSVNGTQTSLTSLATTIGTPASGSLASNVGALGTALGTFTTGTSAASQLSTIATGVGATNTALGTFATGTSAAGQLSSILTGVNGINTNLGTFATGTTVATLLADIRKAVTPRYSRSCLDSTSDADSWQNTGWTSQQECLRDGRLHAIGGSVAPVNTCAGDVGAVLKVLKANKAWGMNGMVHLNDNGAMTRFFGNPHVNATDNPFPQTGEVYFYNQAGGALIAHVSNASDTCIDAANCTMTVCTGWGSSSAITVWVASAPF